MKKIAVTFATGLSFYLCLSISAPAQDWFQTGQEADIVLGPYEGSGGPSALHHPSRVCADTTGRLFVSDARNNRVLIWNSIPLTNSQPADMVVGKPDMDSNDTGGDNIGLNWPIGVYSDGVHLFVADTNNNRVLIWNSVPTQSGEPADVVLGQEDFTSYEERLGSASSLRWPWDVYYDGQHLFVVDTGGGRTLIWNSLPTENGQPADLVVGKMDFNSGGETPPEAALATPRGLATDGTVLAICDYNFHRVLIWNTIPDQNGQSADVVLFQPDFTIFDGEQAPMGIFMHDQKVYVASNHNVYVWDEIPTQNNQEPDYVVGRSDLQPGLSAFALSAPWGVFTDGMHFYVSDTNNSRVLIYNQIPTGSDVPADVVLGQEDFESNVFLSRKGIRSVSGVASTGHHLLLATQVDNRMVIHDGLPEQDCDEADYIISNVDFDTPVPQFPAPDELYQCSQIWTDGSRLYTVELSRGILMWNSMPESSFINPDHVISSTGTGRIPLNGPSGITSDGNRLFVSDTGNNRVVIWNTIPTEDGTPADIVLGQPDFNSTEPGLMDLPSRIATDGNRLAVADMEHHRILIWNTIPAWNNQEPDIRLWDGNPYPGRFNLPQGVFIVNDHLFVADGGFNRVFVWNTFPTTDVQPADVILGQPDSLTTRPRKTRDGLHSPLNLWFDGDYLWVGEFKFADRVIGYRAIIDPTVPNTPESLSIVSATSHQIELSWSDNSYNERGYKVERKTGPGGTYDRIIYLSANTTGYADENLPSNTRYFYRIRAYNRYGDSGFSNEADTTTSTTNNPPYVPSNPSPGDGETGVSNYTPLWWNGGDPDRGDIVTYDVYLDTYNPPVFLATTVHGWTDFSPGPLSLLTTYYWKVIARDIDDEQAEGPIWSFETADFPGEKYTLDISTDSGGTTFPRPGSKLYMVRDSVFLIALPDSGHSFYGWSGDISDTTNPIFVVMESDKSITAHFTTTGIEGDEGTSAIPRTLVLHQNYPNPFNPTTTISFDLPGKKGQKQEVSLSIYDLRGRHVRNLFHGKLKSGNHSITWDGRNSGGIQVSSGVYFYSLELEDGTLSRKMILIK